MTNFKKIYRGALFLISICMPYGVFMVNPVLAAGFTVNSLSDDSDLFSGDGICATASSVCTLRAALKESAAHAGPDTITITATGVTVPFTAYSVQDDTAGVTIIGPGSSNFEIDASNLSNNKIIDFGNSDNGGVSGITISHTPGTAISVTDSDNNIFDDLVLIGMGVVGTTLIEVGGSSGNTFSNNDLSNAGIGIRVGFNSNNNIVSDNNSHDNVHSGITISDSAFNVVTGNTIANISDDFGMFVIGGADHNTISNNTIANAHLGGMTLGIIGPDSGTITNNVISHNTITGSGSGIGMSGVAENNTFEANTISNNTGAGISISYNSLDLPQYVAEGNIFKGNMVTENDGSGFDFSHVADLVIGGSNPGDGNVVAGNGDQGISVKDADGIAIQGNYIGFESDGTTLLPNDSTAVNIEDASNVVIGGAASLVRNIISGATGVGGITVSGTVSVISITGNYIGLDKNGLFAGNLSAGIVLQGDLSSVIIGGTNPGEGNVIAGISDGGFGMGIRITGSHARIWGNKIGTTITGSIASGYGNDIGIGILENSESNSIGGLNNGEANTIAGNGTGIIMVDILGDYPQSNSVLKNSILGNNNNGIDFASFDGVSITGTGPTANDLLDVDNGPNGLLNHPVINTVDTTTGVITYTLDVPAGNHRVEFFKNPTSGTHGEGEVFLGYDDFVSAGSSKQQTKTIALSAGDVIAATATEDLGGGSYGSTSEFSQAYSPVAIVVPSNTPIVTSGTISGGTVRTKENPFNGTQCPAHMVIHDYMKNGDTNGKYSAYNKGVIKDVSLLQGHINRILSKEYAQAAGPVDIWFRSLTKQGVERIQKKLNQILPNMTPLKIDGIVGPFTRDAINMSC